MFNGDVEHVLPLVGADIATVPVGLLLKIVVPFPDHIVLNHGAERGYTGEIGWMQHKFQERGYFVGQRMLLCLFLSAFVDKIK
jgi:hypothetical protein